MDHHTKQYVKYLFLKYHLTIHNNEVLKVLVHHYVTKSKVTMNVIIWKKLRQQSFRLDNTEFKFQIDVRIIENKQSIKIL